jgi:hypothetical protein
VCQYYHLKQLPRELATALLEAEGLAHFGLHYDYSYLDERCWYEHGRYFLQPFADSGNEDSDEP